MPFNITALIDEAKGVAPVTFKTTFSDSKIVYPAVEEPSRPEPTATNPVAMKQHTKKHAVNKHAIVKTPSKMTTAPQGRSYTVTAEIDRVFPDTLKQTVAKSTVEKLSGDFSPARKGFKSSRAVRRPVSKLPTTADLRIQDVREQERLDDEFDAKDDNGNTFADLMHLARFSERAPADWEAQAEKEMRAIGIDADVRGGSKKRSYDEFEITAETDLTALEALATTPLLEHAPAHVEPANKKLKIASGKAGVPRATTKKRSVIAKYSDQEAEPTLLKNSAKKAVSRTTSKTSAAEVKAKKPAAAMKIASLKKLAVNKKLAKVLGKGDDAPGTGAKLTAVQLAARKARKQ